MRAPTAATLDGLLTGCAAVHGERTALVFKDRTFSFAEIDRLSNRLSNALAHLGVREGDRVTLYAHNCWEWIVSYYAIAKLGAISNPINVMLTPEEVLYIVKDCGARAVLTSQDRGAPLLDLRADSPLETVIFFGAAKHACAHSFEALLEGASDDWPRREAADSGALASIMYTSGTTGHPKGAALTHRNLVFNAAMTANMHARTAADIVVTALPLPHVYGGAILNSCLVSGASLVLLERFNEAAALELIERQRATMFEGVPTMYMYLLNHPDLNTRDLSSLTRCTVGGQTMPVTKMEEVEERFDCRLLELWGMTELGGLGTTHPAYADSRLGSIGIPLPGVDCRIAHVSNSRESLAPGEVGELMVRGPVVMTGYYGNERATREVLEPDGWLHTGDLARADADGYVFVVDRKKDMIITAGYNVYPAEIERVIAMHPAVSMVAVGSQADVAKGEVAKAYVVLRNGDSVDEQVLISFCREHLAAYKVPRAIQFVPDLPKTSTGKILRRRLNTLDAAASVP